MTLSKETLEAATPVAKPAAPTASAPAADTNRLRADAVSLDVPVKVHGSRVTEVRGTVPQTEPFEEEASTMIVFPHGGVVRLTTTVSVGQMLVLTNLRTNQDAICRVVKVRAYSNTQAYVEVEFTHRQAGYWGVHFPADDEDASNAGAASAAEPEKKPAIAPVTMKVEPLPKASAPAPRPESAFAGFGSKEEVQLAATNMEPKLRVVPPPAPAAVVRPPAPVVPPAPVASVAPVAAAPVAPVTHAPAAPVATNAAPAQPVHIAATRDILNSLPVEAESLAPAESQRSSPSFGSFTGGITQSSNAAASSTPDFGAQHQAAAPSSGNWKWIAACAFFTVLGVAGGALYFRQHAAVPTAPASGTSSVVEQSSAPAQSTNSNATQSSAQGTTTNIPEPAVAMSAPTVDRSSHSAPVEADQSSPVQSRNAAPARSLALAPITAPPSVNFAASSARPVARKAGGNIDTAAPTVGGALGGSALPDVLGASNSTPLPPPVQPRVGGQIISPKLLKSVAPIYPSSARAANVAGNVVIAAQVDKQGNITSMKVISGPASLQMAAMSAMKQWKYSPGTLDGEPVATQVTVTIKFQAQQ